MPRQRHVIALVLIAALAGCVAPCAAVDPRNQADLLHDTRIYAAKLAAECGDIGESLTVRDWAIIRLKMAFIAERLGHHEELERLRMRTRP